MKIGLQLYSLREALGLDYLGTLQQVKQMGYSGVELYGDHHSADATKAMLETSGLTAIAHHFSFEQLHSDFNACAERAKAIGTDFLVCSWSMPSEMLSWQEILSGLSEIALNSQNANLRFAYHNHDHEIRQSLNETSVLEQMLRLVNAEIDVAWVHAGGQNPAVFLEQNAHKAHLLHIKDVLLEHDAWQTVELGQGTVPLHEVLVATSKTPSEWLIIEQDHSLDPMGSAARNFLWLKAALT
jgi:sugar phosphate isomerase/epimerase